MLSLWGGSEEAAFKAVLEDKLKRRKKDETSAEFDSLTGEITDGAEKVEFKEGEGVISRKKP